MWKFNLSNKERWIIMDNNVRYRGWAWGWGIFLLLIAALVLSNQIGGFIKLGIWSIIVASLAVAFLVKCIIDLAFGSIPIPIAALYFIFQTPLGLPAISFWPLVLVTVLATAGLHILFPPRIFYRKKKHDHDWQYSSYQGNYRGSDRVDGIVVEIEDGINEVEAEIEGMYGHNDETKVKEGGGDNNPQISVQFGAASRYLHANSLKTVELNCSFGSLEVYFDHVELNPNGAEAFLNCKFGAIELYVPSHWQIIDNTRASVGAVDIKRSRVAQDVNAPQLTLSGGVSVGGIEVQRI